MAAKMNTTVEGFDRLRAGMSVSINGRTEGLGDRLEISSGSDRVIDPTYTESAYLSKTDWRGLTEQECSILSATGSDPSCGEAESVTLWRLPQRISENFDLMRTAIEKHNDEQVVANLFNHPSYRRGRLRLVELCRDAEIADGYRILGHYTRRIGVPSTSVQEDGLYVGLHVDSWRPGVPLERSGFPMRLCVNLGPEHRYLQFINLSFRQMEKYADYSMSDRPNQFVVDFLHRFPDYPILQLRIEPGEGYIAATEFMIHNASTVGKKYVDASFTILGDFCPRVVTNMIELAKR